MVCVRHRLRLGPAVPGPRRCSGSRAGAAAIRPLLLRRPATTATRQHGPAASPRDQVQLRRPDHLAGPDRHPDLSGRPGRHRHRQGVDRAASQTAAPPRPRHRWATADRARTILRVQVERVPAKTRPPKVLWLWWAGPGSCDLDLAWRAYVRRFDLEHTIRFCKQTLGWTTPRPRHPAQAERWTWLVLAADAQLRLARAAAGDQRLPWEVPRPQPRRSPYRVRRGFPRLLCALGSPAATPKPWGCSPAGPRAGPLSRLSAIRRSRSPPPSPGRRPPAQPRPPDRAATSTTRPPPRPAASPARHRVKSQA